MTLGVNPRACGDPGWQLSFAAVAGILTLAPSLRRPLGPLPRPLAEGIAITLAATVATAPLMAHHFGTSRWPACPPTCSPCRWSRRSCGWAWCGRRWPSWPAAQPLVDLAGLPLAPLLSALASLAMAFADMPGGQLGLPLRGPAAVTLAYAATGSRGGRLPGWPARVDPAPAAARWRRARPQARIGAVAVAGAALALGLFRLAGPPSPPAGFTVSFLDVGQGDATLVQAPGGVAILFDGGPPEAGVSRELRAAGVRELSLVVATHQSRDHHGGLQQVVERLRVGSLLQNGDGTRDPTFRRVVDTARARGARIATPRQGQILSVGDVTIRVLGPPPRDPGPAPEDPNPRALAAVVSYRGFDLFLSGDAESDALAEYDLPPVEAMKVSHHGSADEGLPALLERLRPRVAAIEVGADNTYGHPAPSTCARSARPACGSTGPIATEPSA